MKNETTLAYITKCTSNILNVKLLKIFLQNEVLFNIIEVIKLILNPQKCIVLVANEITELSINCC
jgi:hypothetical protein